MTPVRGDWNTEQWLVSHGFWSTAGRSSTQPAAQSYAKHLCDRHEVITRVTNPEGVEVCRYYPGGKKPAPGRQEKYVPGPAWFLGQT